MSEHRCPSTYMIKTGDEASTIIQCRYWRGHDSTSASLVHISIGGLVWSDADEHHEPPPPPEPLTPWVTINSYGVWRRTFYERSGAEIHRLPGGRIMKLVDADAVVVEPVAVDQVEKAVGWPTIPGYVREVLAAAGVPIKGAHDG